MIADLSSFCICFGFRASDFGFSLLPAVFPFPFQPEILTMSRPIKVYPGGGVSPMRGILSVIALTIMLPALPACTGPQALGLPNLAHPGTEEYQQTRAKVFEPYPDNEVGPPVVGARPREYQEPVPETILRFAATRRASSPSHSTTMSGCAGCSTSDRRPAARNLLSADGDAAVVGRSEAIWEVCSVIRHIEARRASEESAFSAR